MRIVFRIVFWISVCWLILFLWIISFGQSSSFEFSDPALRNRFYNLIFDVTPFAVMATLFGTIRKKQKAMQKLLIVFGTFLLSCGTVLYLLSHMFTLGFGSWTTTRILYKHRQDNERMIVQQQYDAGALGYGSERVVIREPAFFFFHKMTAADTNRLDKGQWQYVNRQLTMAE